MIKVVNRNMAKANGAIRFNIMRGTALGNPFRMNGENTRMECIKQYSKWIGEKIENGDMSVIKPLLYIKKLSESGKVVELACCCKPKACHGDIIKQIIEKEAS